MNVKQAIETRRALRSLERVQISDEIIRELFNCATLAPSCFNKQPWHFVFARSDEKLELMASALSRGNEWAALASLIIGVHSSAAEGCIVKDREYYQYDCGTAVGFLILRATELGLIAHPIAGFKEDIAKQILGIPDEQRLITLVIVGKRSSELFTGLSESQLLAEHERPPRKDFDEIARVI